jgi:geranylgeranyl transferase type-2 subunit alpha
MHGRVRGRDSGKDAAEREAIKEAISRKAAMYSDLTALLSKMRRAGDTSAQALELTSKVLRINPDYYSLWNYRREVLLALHSESIGLKRERMDGLGADDKDRRIALEIGVSVREQELNLSTEAIMKNPKAYGAWWHRIWILQRFCVDYARELKLCCQFLDQDQRNFHCWNYRRYVAKSGRVSSAEEFRYSTEKIEQNFSNYSAFHHRSVYILQLEHKSIDSKTSAISIELAIVENAVFTDPFDQSAWWYHRFLLNWLKSLLPADQPVESSVLQITDLNKNDNIVARDFCSKTLASQIETLRGLVDLEPQCKWPLDALVNVLTLQQVLTRQGLLPCLPHSTAPQQLETTSADIISYLQRLKLLDPARAARYDYLLGRLHCSTKSDSAKSSV